MSLDDLLLRATREHWAMPHFNFATDEQLKAIGEVCLELQSPVMVGTSEGERNFMGLEQVISLVASYQKEGLLIFLNADHSRSIASAQEAIDAGYESIHIDLSKQTLEDNIAGTKEVVKYARKTGRKISIEGELGYLPTSSSKIYKEEIFIDPKTFTKPKEAQRFVVETGVDRFAPAVGNLHGIAANKPNLDFDLIKTLRESLPQKIALVLHGGSGVDRKDFKKAIDLGFSNIHISTELRQAWKEGLKKSLRTEEYAPYKILSLPVEEIKKVVEGKINIFGSANRY